MRAQLEKKTFTKLCEKNTVITVNGEIPGPTIHVHDGDTVIIKVYNKAGYNATIHWYVSAITLIILFHNISTAICLFL